MFNQLTPTNEILTINNFIISEGGFTGSINLQGSIITPLLTISESFNSKGITKKKK